MVVYSPPHLQVQRLTKVYKTLTDIEKYGLLTANGLGMNQLVATILCYLITRIHTDIAVVYTIVEKRGALYSWAVQLLTIMVF